MSESRLPATNSEPLLQRSEAWFSARIGKINASELDKVLGFGFGRDEARKKLFVCLREHAAPEPFSNDATRWGQEHETEALAMYAQHSQLASGLRTREHGGMTHATCDWLRASPDALLYDNDDRLVGLVEIKCPYRLRNDPPPFENSLLITGYLLQMNLQMEVYDVDFCDFVQWTPLGIAVRRVNRNRNLFRYVLPLYEEFHRLATQTSTPYERLDPSVVMHTEERVVDLYHEVESCRFERILNREPLPSDNSR